METNPLQNTSDQTKLPDDLTSLIKQEVNHKIAALTDTFLDHIDKLHGKYIVLIDQEGKNLYCKHAYDSSRYSPSGLQKIREKVRRRLHGYPATFGVMSTLTIAEFEANAKYYHGRSQLEAWESINKFGSEFTEEVNKWRKRHGLKTIRAYVKVLEIQPKRFYPHLHIYFPGLKWLAPTDVLQKLWPYGNVDIQYTDSKSPGDYITKYLSKMEAKDFMNVMLYSFKLRMFSNSQGLRYAPDTKKPSALRWKTSGSHFYAFGLITQYLKHGWSLTRRSATPLAAQNTSFQEARQLPPRGG